MTQEIQLTLNLEHNVAAKIINESTSQEDHPSLNFSRLSTLNCEVIKSG